MTNVLTVKDLKKSYKRGFIPRASLVLKGVNFSVPSGSITGFLGGNGAGKTTTMRCMLGLDFADSGDVNFFGAPLNQDSKKKIGFLPERPYFYEHLTGREFLQFYARLSGSWNNKVLNSRIDDLLKRVDLLFAKDRPLRNYSKGMLQKVGVAQALIHDPELVILDEPMSGLDPDGRMYLSDIITETAKRGTAVFFSSHLLHDMERLCQRLVVLKEGACIYEGTTESLLDRSGVDYEIIYFNGGSKETKKVATQDEVQPALKSLLSNGAKIDEVRRIRSTLEEIFVKMALKGKS